jgi:hypothetical protein
MSFLALLIAALLSGASSFTAHAHDVIGGGSVLGASVDNASGGGLAPSIRQMP